MSNGMEHHPLEVAYWISQTAAAGLQLVLVAVAIWAGLAAYRQVNTFKLFEWLKYIQDDNFRSARRIVIREISPIMDTEWWQDDRLEMAGATCCASYDILGRMLQFGGSQSLVAFFIENWGDSIVRTWLILSPFIEHRRESGGYQSKGYEWLFVRARKQFPNIGVSQPLSN